MLTAAAQPPIDDPEARLSRDDTVVSSLSIHTGSPAWWVVSKGSSRVQVLGAPWYAPEDFSWIKISLRKRLRNTSLLVTPPILASSEGREAVNLTTSATMTPEQAARLRAAAADHGLAAEKYLAVSPLLAGYLLTTDFRARYGLRPERIIRDVQDEAAAIGGVRIMPAARLPSSAALKSLNGVTAAAERACLDAALEEVEAGPQPMRDALDAWLAGDVGAALAAPRGLERCTFATPGQADLRRAAIKAEVDIIQTMIEDQRSSAGISQGRREGVAVVSLRSLVADGGILDQLRQRGFRIEAPEAAD